MAGGGSRADRRAVTGRARGDQWRDRGAYPMGCRRRERGLLLAQLSGLGFGGASVGNLRRAIDDDQAQSAIRHAWARGIRYFDTAPHYGLGLSERRLGDILRERPRDEFVVSTKVGRVLVPRRNPIPVDDEGFDVPGVLERRWDFSVGGVETSLGDSRQRLGVDHIDIAFVHDPDQAWDGAAGEGLRSLANSKSRVRWVRSGSEPTPHLGSWG